MKKAPSMLLASAGVTVGLLGFALPASAATSSGPAPSQPQSALTAPKLPQGNAPIVTGPKYGKHTADGNISFRNNENPCKFRKPEPCPTKPCRTEKPKPCQKRPCPPPVHRHHKKCDIRKNVT